MLNDHRIKIKLAGRDLINVLSEYLKDSFRASDRKQ
jgi:hypothetical protein